MPQSKDNRDEKNLRGSERNVAQVRHITLTCKNVRNELHRLKLDVVSTLPVYSSPVEFICKFWRRYSSIQYMKFIQSSFLLIA